MSVAKPLCSICFRRHRAEGSRRCAPCSAGMIQTSRATYQDVGDDGKLNTGPQR